MMAKRSCSNCTHSQFEGYCGQMAVCNDWQPRTSLAELLPTKSQINDEMEFNSRQLTKKTKKPPKKKSKGTHGIKRSVNKQSKSAAGKKSHAEWLRENQRVKETFEHREPIHAFPRNECSKARIIKEVRGWCKDHGFPYHNGYEGETKEKLISRFICNERDVGGKKTGNYRPDPVKVAQCFPIRSNSATE